MAYVRYIKVNGKLYGPYLYESKRKGKKVKGVYLGKAASDTTPKDDKPKQEEKEKSGGLFGKVRNLFTGGPNVPEQEIPEQETSEPETSEPETPEEESEEVTLSMIKEAI